MDVLTTFTLANAILVLVLVLVLILTLGKDRAEGVNASLECVASERASTRAELVNCMIFI